jgi:hypothetical protein
LDPKLYLEDLLTIHKYLDRIYALLPELDEESLITLASYFDPFGETMTKAFNFKVVRSESERLTRMSGIALSQIEEVLHFLLEQQLQQQ